MPLITASAVSAWLDDLLQADCEFKVQSVFSGSFNLICGGRLLHVGSNQKSLAPFGVAVEPAGLNRLLPVCRPGQSVVYSKEKNWLIWETGEAIALEAAEIYSGKMLPKRRGKAVISESLKGIRPLAERIIMQKECGLNLSAMPAELETLRNFMRNPKPEDTAAVLDYWIGRGPGLTPSGDDMMVGMLAAFWWADCRQCLEYVKTYIDSRGTERTTLVSCEYLRYAVRGIFSQELISLTEALENQENLSDSLTRVLESGHTSGADTLIGVYMAIELISEGLYGA